MKLRQLKLKILQFYDKTHLHKCLSSLSISYNQQVNDI